MAITIYTYSNPYKIDKEPYWASIQNCFHLCVSQTLVNGMSDQYKDFFQGKLTTISNFINILYENWESDTVAISQRAAIDNVIEYFDFTSIVDDIDSLNIKNSLKRNRIYVFESIRTMFELGMEPSNIKVTELTYEQKCVVEIYKELKHTHNRFFELKNDFTEDEINKAITNTITTVVKNSTQDDISQIRNDSVIIHGIHQFSPIMLKTIEVLSKYKLVVILFNYQSDYKSVYQTWLDVYSSFESKVVFSPKNLNNESQSFEGGKIADNLAALISGNTAAIDFLDRVEVTEFDNSTEFAGYIAKLFEEAQNRRKEDGFSHPTLYYMGEQFYAANSNVNTILKIYFPEQFGERDFLDYPIGYFFLSITNMWDPETQSLCIKDIQDLYECFSCGIIVEQVHGRLISIFDKCKLFFSNETTISGITKKLKKLKNLISDLENDEQECEECLRVEYFDLTESDLDELINALKDLNSITKYFYEDFNDKKNDFKTFYKKIGEVLVTHVLDVQDIDDEFKDIVQRVLLRLNEVNDVEASASFDCLRETMQLYLKQIPKEGHGANWIVRNFEQIDGDVLRKNSNNQIKTYHFACLSDKDMSVSHKDEFPWPLNTDFFEVAQAPIDWKYQVFVSSRMEYRNFRRYALVYGLAFSRCRIKLSYIKNEGNKVSELYYLLKILNANIRPYEPKVISGYRKSAEYIKMEELEMNQFNQYDLMKYRLCSYRFLMESVIEERSVYKDEFLLIRYLTVILEHRARRHFNGQTYVKNIVFYYLNEQIDELKSKFTFINQADMIDIVRSAMDYIEKYAVSFGKFAQIKEKELDHMVKRENFLSVKSDNANDTKYKEIFKNSTQDEIDNILSKENLSKEKYKKTLNTLCDNCSEKDICLESFKSKKK